MKKYGIYIVFFAMAVGTCQTTMPITSFFKRIATRVCNAVVSRPTETIVLGTTVATGSLVYEKCVSPQQKNLQKRTDIIIDHIAVAKHAQKKDNKAPSFEKNHFIEHAYDKQMVTFSVLYSSPITRDFKTTWLQKIFGKKITTEDDEYTSCYKQTPHKAIHCKTIMPAALYYARLNEQIQKKEQAQQDAKRKAELKKNMPPLTLEEEMKLIRSLSF